MRRRWIELCAGTGATTLRLVGGPRLNPVVGMIGCKRRQASTILGMCGRRPGEGASAILLVDAGPWGWVWPTLLEHPGGVAGHMRGWVGRDPRVLWTDLAAEGPPEDLVERAAAWLCGVPRPAGQKGDGRLVATDHATGRTMRDGQTGQDRRRLRQGSGAGRPDQPAGQRNPTGEMGTSGKGLTSPETVARRVEVVARWLVLQAGSSRGKAVTVGPNGTWKTHGFAHLSDLARAKGFRYRFDVEVLADRVEALRFPGGNVAVYNGDVADLVPTGDLSDTDVLFDPPYVDRTGYGWDCARAQVVTTATSFADAGARVLVCEAEPVAELVELGWLPYNLSHLGRSNAGPEWVTTNAPAARFPQVGEQRRLFAPGVPL